MKEGIKPLSRKRALVDCLFQPGTERRLLAHKLVAPLYMVDRLDLADDELAIFIELLKEYMVERNEFYF